MSQQLTMGFGVSRRWLAQEKTDWGKLWDVLRDGARVVIDNRVRTQPRYMVRNTQGRVDWVAISQDMADVLVEQAEARGWLPSAELDWRPLETVPEDFLCIVVGILRDDYPTAANDDPDLDIPF